MPYLLLFRNLLPFLVVLILHIFAIWLLSHPEKPQAKTLEPKVLFASLVASSAPKVNANIPVQKNLKTEAVTKPEPKPKIKQKTKTVPKALSTAPQTLSEPMPEKETKQKKTPDLIETTTTNTKKEAEEHKQIPDNKIETTEDSKSSEDTVVTTIKVDARSTQNYPPVYPKLSKRLKEEGTVVLSMLISSLGQIKKISIHESSGYSRLDKAALSAATKWRYQPATVNGMAIEQHYLMPIEFKLNTSKR
jgi:protein TonB